MNNVIIRGRRTYAVDGQASVLKMTGADGRAQAAVVNGSGQSTIRVTQATMATPPSACWANPPQLTISVTP